MVFAEKIPVNLSSIFSGTIFDYFKINIEKCQEKVKITSLFTYF